MLLAILLCLAAPTFAFKGDLEGATDSVRAVAFSTDGKLLLAGDDDGQLTIFNLDARKRLAQVDSHHGKITALALSTASGLVASTGKDGFVRLWDPASGALVRAFKASGDPLFALAFSPSGNALATGGEDQVVRVYDPDSGLLQLELKGHDDTIRSVAFVDGGKSLISSASDKTIRLWDLATRKETRDQTERAAEYGDLQGLAVSTSGNAFVALDRELARAEGGLRTLSGRGGPGVVENHVLILRDLASWTELGRLEGHARTIHAAAFSPDGALLASVGDDQALIVWDRAARAKLVAFDLPDKQWAVQFSPDGRLLAAGGDDRKVHLYGVKQPAPPEATPALAPAPAPTAAAQAEPPTANAKAIYEQGRREFNLGHYKEALELFEQSYKLQPATRLLYNIGQCHRLLGDLESARRVYRAYINESPPGDPVVPQAEAKLKEIESALKAQSSASQSPPSNLANEKPQK